MKEKKIPMKLIALAMTLALVLGCGIGGTVAWLSMKTESVTNTFTAGNIDITLTETWNADSDDEGTELDHWENAMVPGTDVKKDPVVTVKGGSEDCWLFVKVDESCNVEKVDGTGNYYLTDFITYTVDTGTTNDPEWKVLDGVSGVYYREVSTSTSDQSFYVLKGKGDSNGDLTNGYIHVNEEITKAMMDKIVANSTLTLNFTAYAVQKTGFSTVSEAWDEAKNAATPTS